MAHTIAGVVICDRGRYLLVQENLEKCYGQWNWPAGYVDDGETAEQAAVREVKEEVGLDVKLSEKAGEWFDADVGRTRVLFFVDRFSGEMTIQNSEILGAAWFTASEIIAIRDSLRVQDWMIEVIELKREEDK